VQVKTKPKKGIAVSTSFLVAGILLLLLTSCSKAMSAWKRGIQLMAFL